MRRKVNELSLPCTDLKQAHALRAFLIEEGVNPEKLYVTCFDGAPTVAASFSVKLAVTACKRIAGRFFRRAYA